MDAPTYLSTWSLINSLWPEWHPNDATASLCAERWSSIRQDKLQEAVKLHKMEASGQYKEPKIHRIMEIYAARTASSFETSEPAREKWQVPEPTQQELDEWDRWAEDVLSDVTEDELEQAQKLVPASGNRMLACAVDYLRKKAAGIKVLPERQAVR